LFFFDLNIIFNLSHPSNHSQTLTNSLSIQSTLRERAGKEERYSSIFKSSLLCIGLRVTSRLQICTQFIFRRNFENDVKIWLLKLLLQK